MRRTRTPLSLLNLEDRLVPATQLTPPDDTTPALLATDVAALTIATPATVRLDPGFGSGGVVTIPETPTTIPTTIQKVVGLPDGRTLVLGRTGGATWFVARRLADGQPDPAFGTNGQVTLFPPTVTPASVSLPAVGVAYLDLIATPDGGAVVVGFEGSSMPVESAPFNTPKVTRVLADGRLDEAFNTAAAQAVAAAFGTGRARAVAVAAGPNGTLLVAGTAEVGPATPLGDVPTRAVVLRLKADGTADTAFGTNGATMLDGTGVTADIPGFPLSFTVGGLAVDPAGRVLLAGTTRPTGLAILAIVGADDGNRPFVARLTAAGALDASFAGDGVADLRVPARAVGEPVEGGEGQVEVVGVGVAPDGGIFAGLTDRRRYISQGLVARLTDGGGLALGFGTAGFATVFDGRGLADLAVAPDGTAVLVTATDLNRNPAVSQLPVTTAGVYRVSATGAVRSLGDIDDGQMITAQLGRSVAVDAANRITVGLEFNRTGFAGTDSAIQLARLAASIPLDPGFATNGVAETTANEIVRLIGLPNGDTVALLRVGMDWVVERRLASGQLDPAFGTSGRAVLFDGPDGPLPIADAPQTTYTDLAVTPDGGLVAVGYTTPGFVPVDFFRITQRVNRLTAAGRPDTAFDTAAAAAIAARFGTGEDTKFARTEQVAVAADGSLAVVLNAVVDPAAEASQNPFRAAVLRLNADGTARTGFGTNGVAFVSGTAGFETDRIESKTFPALRVTANRAFFDASGRLLLAGTSSAVLSPGIAIDSTAFNPGGVRPFAARLTAAGALDPTFAGDGVAEPPLPPRFITTDAPPGFDPSNIPLRDAELTPDGGVVFLLADRRAFEPQALLLKVDAAGRPDGTFGAGAVIIADTRGLDDLTVGADGTVLAVSANDFNRNPTADIAPPPDQGLTTVYRVSPAGAVDRLGEVTELGNSGGTLDGGRRITADAAGRVTVAALQLLVSPVSIRLARLAETMPVPRPEPQPAVRPTFAGGANGKLTRLMPDASGRLVSAGDFTPFDSFAGPVRGLSADLNGDGFPEQVFAVGPGGGSRVRILYGQDPRIGAPAPPPLEFSAFEAGFTGGVWLAAGDLTGDGKADLVVTPDAGGGPVVAVYDGSKMSARPAAVPEAVRFFGIDDPAYRGGVRAAAGDLDGDGRADLAVTAGASGGPRAAVFDGKSITGTPRRLRPDFFVFEPSLRTGLSVAVGDLNGDGKAELIFGSGAGGAPRVQVHSGDKVTADFFAGGDVSSRSGSLMAVRDGTLLVGGGGRLRTFAGPALTATGELPATADGIGAVYVG